MELLYVELIDHDSKINIILSDFYNRTTWHIERNHNCKVQAVTKVMEDLCGDGPNIRVMIGDASLDQNFLA